MLIHAGDAALEERVTWNNHKQATDLHRMVGDRKNRQIVQIPISICKLISHPALLTPFLPSVAEYARFIPEKAHYSSQVIDNQTKMRWVI